MLLTSTIRSANAANPIGVGACGARRGAGRLVEVLEAEAHVFQVGINFADAVKPTGACAADRAVRRTAAGGRYAISKQIARGPAVFDIARVDRAGGVDGTAVDALADLGRRATAAGLLTAGLDQVLCLATVSTPPRRDLVL